MASSVGFTIYSWQVKKWVFVVTNGLMVVNGLLGYALVLWQRRRSAQGKKGKGSRGSEVSAEAPVT